MRWIHPDATGIHFGASVEQRRDDGEMSRKSFGSALVEVDIENKIYKKNQHGLAAPSHRGVRKNSTLPPAPTIYVCPKNPNPFDS